MLTDKYDMILYTFLKSGMIIWIASILIRYLSSHIAETIANISYDIQYARNKPSLRSDEHA